LDDVVVADVADAAAEVACGHGGGGEVALGGVADGVVQERGDGVRGLVNEDGGVEDLVVQAG
jgi:hypothetical protein